MVNSDSFHAQDLPAEGFLSLRKYFYDERGEKIAFSLRDKLNTQDDPFDELIAQILARGVGGARCIPATGPLITPDMVLIRDGISLGNVGEMSSELSAIVGIEVKKVERSSSGRVARSTGLDYNTTPPCGTIRVYLESNDELNIRGFYLFACLEQTEDPRGNLIVSAINLCDGNILNEDFDYYLSIVGEREKEIGLGTYANGADRKRPMVIFANPLGSDQLDLKATLLHPSDDLDKEFPDLIKVYSIVRNIPGGGKRQFSGYMFATDVPDNQEVVELVDPFPSPTRRQTRTQGRGKFIVTFAE
jgi:hypothetical protein